MSWAELEDCSLRTHIIVADESWLTPGKFDPERLPASLALVPLDINAHWQRIGYFLLLDENIIVVDGTGICSHRPLAQTYYFLTHGHCYDEQAFCAFEATIRGGWIWPPLPILMGSASFPQKIDGELQVAVIQAFAPDHRLEYNIDDVYWDFGGFTRRSVTDRPQPPQDDP